MVVGGWWFVFVLLLSSSFFFVLLCSSSFFFFLLLSSSFFFFLLLLSSSFFFFCTASGIPPGCSYLKTIRNAPTRLTIKPEFDAMIQYNISMLRTRVKERLFYKIFSNKVWKILFWAILLGYPSVCMRVMRIYQCEEIGNQLLLVHDLSLNCNTPEWLAYTVRGSLSVVYLSSFTFRRFTFGVQLSSFTFRRCFCHLLLSFASVIYFRRSLSSFTFVTTLTPFVPLKVHLDYI